MKAKKSDSKEKRELKEPKGKTSLPKKALKEAVKTVKDKKSK
jgi:hypothetical protein